MPAEAFERRPASPEEVAKETSLPFNLAKIEQISREYPTPFFIYDEEGVRQNARAFKEAFSWNPGFVNFFAVKALPNPHILKILAEEGFGADCSSMVELETAKMVGLSGDKIMFTSNDTPAEEFAKARELGAIINLDDITHFDFLKRHVGIPPTLSFRFNPGPTRDREVQLSGEDAKYGLTKEQLFDGYKRAKEEGVESLGLHTMVASNERNPEFFEETARMLFQLVNELHDELGIKIDFINLGGGVGIPYRPEWEAVDMNKVSSQMKKDYESMIAERGLGPLQVTMECGRAITGPYGFFVARVRHVTEKYRDFVGLDGNTTSMPRAAIYETAYHHATVLGKEGAPREMKYDVTGSLCENNDKWAKQREMPEVHPNDLIVIHDAGAHGIAMANRYNGKLVPGELLLKPDGSVLEIRRPETSEDYFRTVVNFEPARQNS